MALLKVMIHLMIIIEDDGDPLGGIIESDGDPLADSGGGDPVSLR